MSKTPVIHVLLVDDHTLFREGLRRMLDAEPGMQVTGDFATATQALEAVRRHLHFDVALLDYELGRGSQDSGSQDSGAQDSGSPEGGPEGSQHATNGLDLLESLRTLRPEARVLMVTAGMEFADLMRAVQDLGAGIFLKTEPIAELSLAIQRTARGERWISSGAALEMLAKPAKTARPRERMTEREAVVLRGILEGLSNKEIGARMELSESAVKAVLQKLFEKTGVRSRSQLVRYAIEAERTSG